MTDLTYFRSHLSSGVTRDNRVLFIISKEKGLSPFVVGLEIASNWHRGLDGWPEDRRAIVSQLVKDLRDGVYHDQIQEAMK